MRPMATALVVGLAACSGAQTAQEPETYSLLLKGDSQIWCAYRNQVDFQVEAMNLRPTESARVTYSFNRLSKLVYQVEAESGDWIVIDEYTPTDRGAVLRRTNLLAQENLRVVQETVIRGDSVDPFHVVTVSTLDGAKAQLPEVDLPEVSVNTNLSEIPFVQVVAEIRSRAIERLCKKVD